MRINEILENELQNLLENLGCGRTDGVAYDTAWVARLSQYYKFEPIVDAMTWLRQHQYSDGSWGAPVAHAHDRYLSTLAAIVSLKTVGCQVDDWNRIQKGEDILWHLAGRLIHDDHDTIGFPVLLHGLTEEARELNLDVPEPPARFASAYKKKVDALLAQEKRNWRENPVSFSLEVLRHQIQQSELVIDDNESVAVSPSATAGYLLEHENEAAMNYLLKSLNEEGSGAARAVDPIDDFEVIWALNHLRAAELISPENKDVKRVLEKLWETWQRKNGLGYSSYNLLTDVDGTAAGWAVLKWGGYPVSSDIFAIYEADDYFLGFLSETDPALSANLRVLIALKSLDVFDRKKPWTDKILRAIRNMDKNGIYWTDKWHTSPYYANTTALWVLHGLDDNLVNTRLRWLLHTQRKDGGWGFFNESTPEETAYCMEALLWYDENVAAIDDSIFHRAANYLAPHISDERYTPLWIGKSLYSPHYVVKAAIVGAMYRFLRRKAQNIHD